MKPRAIHFVSAAIIGLGIGIFIYRFAVLGFFWAHPLKFVFPAIGAGLVAAGFKIQSMDTQGERPPGSTRIALVIVGIGVAMGLLYLLVPTLARTSLERHELPGFSLSLPTAKPDTERLDYNTGTVTWDKIGGSSSMLAISWQGGTALREDLEAAMKAVAEKVGTGVSPVHVEMAGPDGKPVDTMSVDAGDGLVHMSMLQCGTRAVMVVSGGASGIEKVHARIVASFHCTPDAAKEAMSVPGQVRVALSLPGSFVSEKEVGQVSLINADNTQVLIVREISAGDAHLADVIGPMLNAFGADVKVKPAVGDRIPFSGTMADVSVEGWARVINCPAHDIMLLGMAGDAANADAVYKVSANAGCLRDGEKPPVWPEATEQPTEAPADRVGEDATE